MPSGDKRSRGSESSRSNSQDDESISRMDDRDRRGPHRPHREPGWRTAHDPNPQPSSQGTAINVLYEQPAGSVSGVAATVPQYIFGKWMVPDPQPAPASFDGTSSSTNFGPDSGDGKVKPNVNMQGMGHQLYGQPPNYQPPLPPNWESTFDPTNNYNPQPFPQHQNPSYGPDLLHGYIPPYQDHLSGYTPIPDVPLGEAPAAAGQPTYGAIAAQQSGSSTIASNSHRCEECPRNFARKDNLDRHRSEVHGKSRKTQVFPCSKWGRLFKAQRYVWPHEKVCNPGERFTCKFCGNEYDRRALKVAHEAQCWGSADSKQPRGPSTPPPPPPAPAQSFHAR